MTILIPVCEDVFLDSPLIKRVSCCDRVRDIERLSSLYCLWRTNNPGHLQTWTTGTGPEKGTIKIIIIINDTLQLYSGFQKKEESEKVKFA